MNNGSKTALAVFATPRCDEFDYNQCIIFWSMKMKKLALFALLVLLSGCTQDKQNEISRKFVEFLDGDYLITYANGQTTKTWTVRNGKVTSTDKGYYYFWDEKKRYVQTPIENTFIEEIKG